MNDQLRLISERRYYRTVFFHVALIWLVCFVAGMAFNEFILN